MHIKKNLSIVLTVFLLIPSFLSADQSVSSDVPVTTPQASDAVPAQPAADPDANERLLMESFGLNPEEAQKILSEIDAMKVQRVEEELAGDYELPSSIPGYTRDEIREIEDQAEEKSKRTISEDLRDLEQTD